MIELDLNPVPHGDDSLAVEVDMNTWDTYYYIVDNELLWGISDALEAELLFLTNLVGSVDGRLSFRFTT